MKVHLKCSFLLVSDNILLEIYETCMEIQFFVEILSDHLFQKEFCLQYVIKYMRTMRGIVYVATGRPLPIGAAAYTSSSTGSAGWVWHSCATHCK